MPMAERQGRPARISLLGVALADCSRGLALAWIRAWLAGSRGRSVFTVNPEFVMAARRDRDFAATLATSDLNLIDGAGLLLAARLHGHSRVQRVPGIDLVPELCNLCARGGHSIYLLGGRAGAAAAAAAVLARRHPGLQIAGTAEPAAPVGEADRICRQIRASGARLLLVAFGTPGQETWIAENLARSGAGVGVGVGGSFDVISGRVKRAPKLLRQLGLEWLFRLLIQPWRWRRQRVLPGFALLALTGALRIRLARRRRS